MKKFGIVFLVFCLAACRKDKLEDLISNDQDAQKINTKNANIVNPLNYLIDMGTYYIPKLGVKKLENLVIEKSLYINRKKVFDHFQVIGCTFQNCKEIGILVDSANFVKILDCRFLNIEGSGIQIASRYTSKNDTIENCFFKNIWYTAINSSADANGGGGALNGVIINNVMDSVGLKPYLPNGVGADYTHGIYWKAKNVLIENNVIYNVFCPGGCGISVRSSGKVQRNTVYNVMDGAAISYHSNYPAQGGTLLVENNIVYDSKEGLHFNGYGTYTVNSATLRFNTLICSNPKNNLIISSYTNFLGIKINIGIYGNLCLNPTGSANCFTIPWNPTTGYVYSVAKNYTTQTDPGFLNYVGKDFHLTHAILATTIIQTTQIPAKDKDAIIRNKPTDYGAYKY